MVSALWHLVDHQRQPEKCTKSPDRSAKTQCKGRRMGPKWKSGGWGYGGGMFDAAREMLSRCKDDRRGVTWGVISKLVDARTVGPVRFKI